MEKAPLIRGVKYGALLGLALWWFPVIGPFILGIIIGFVVKRNPQSIIASSIVSLLLSGLTETISLLLVEVKILGELFPLGALFLDLVGSVACIGMAYIVTDRMVFVRSVDGMRSELDFHASSVEDAYRRVSTMFNLRVCSEPHYLYLNENEVRVTIECPQGVIEYRVSRDMSGVRVHLTVNSK